MKWKHRQRLELSLEISESDALLSLSGEVHHPLFSYLINAFSAPSVLSELVR